MDGADNIVSSIGHLIGNLDYIEVFGISFLSSIILFIPIPYVPFLVIASFNGNLNPGLLALVSAVGVTAGRTIIFLLGYFARKKILSYKIKRNTKPLARLLKKYGWVVSFLAALTPFPPDDMVIIMLGMTKFSPLQFIITNFAGKLIANIIVVAGTALTGKSILQAIILGTQSPTNLIFMTILSIAIGISIIYCMVKLDWAKVIGRLFPWTLEDNKYGNDDDDYDYDKDDKNTDSYKHT